MSPEGKGARTQAAILEAALAAFRREGYEAATLAGIASELGITRSAVLHHFPSKAELLRAVVRPYVEQMDVYLDEVEVRQPITPRTRRRIVGEIIDLIASNRQVAVLVTVDVAVNAHLAPDLLLFDRALRFMAITQDTAGSHLAAVRSLAALGTVVRPMAADDLIDFDDPEVRELLVECVLAVMRTPLPVSGGSAPTRGRGGS